MRMITRPRRARLLGLAAVLGLVLAGYTPALALVCGSDSGGQPQALYCGDDTCQVRMCGPGQLRYPQGFPPGSACPGKRIGSWGMAGDGQTYMTVCVSQSMPHIGCHWRSGPPNNHRYSGDMSEDCSNAPHVKMPSWSTQAPSPGPQYSWRSLTQGSIEVLVHNATDGENSGWSKAAINVFRNRYAGAKLAGPSGDTMGGQVSQFGRFLSAQLGVGTCTRHFYNHTNYDWAVALIHAGSCHVQGKPAGPDAICMVPPHATAELDYSNTAMNQYGAQIAIAGAHPGGTYEQTFRLRVVGCYIKHNGNTGHATLNDPADGDVATDW